MPLMVWVTEPPRPDEGDVLVAEPCQVADHGRDAAAIVDRDGGDARLLRALPQGHHRDAAISQLLHEPGPVTQVTQE